MVIQISARRVLALRHAATTYQSNSTPPSSGAGGGGRLSYAIVSPYTDTKRALPCVEISTTTLDNLVLKLNGSLTRPRDNIQYDIFEDATTCGTAGGEEKLVIQYR